jgi:hypothetical protein
LQSQVVVLDERDNRTHGQKRAQYHKGECYQLRSCHHPLRTGRSFQLQGFFMHRPHPAMVIAPFYSNRSAGDVVSASNTSTSSPPSSSESRRPFRPLQSHKSCQCHDQLLRRLHAGHRRLFGQHQLVSAVRYHRGPQCLRDHNVHGLQRSVRPHLHLDVSPVKPHNRIREHDPVPVLPERGARRLCPRECHELVFHLHR